MLLRSAAARAITARSSALRARSRWSSQALRCALDDAIAAIKGDAIGRARLDGTYEIR